MRIRVTFNLQGDAWDDLCDAMAQATNEIIDGRITGTCEAGEARCHYLLHADGEPTFGVLQSEEPDG